MDFEAFIKDIQRNKWKVYGVEVYSKGELLHTYGQTIEALYPIYSATKTILSIAVGIAYDEEKISLEKSILDYLLLEQISSLTLEQVKAFENISLERLLTMSVSGFPFRPEGESYLKYALTCRIEEPSIGKFSYSNIPAYLVGVALTHAIQEDLYDYINRKILQPLHIINPIYTRCPEGYFYGASGMELSVHDFSKIGLLLYHGGTYEEKRIVSEEYVKKATSIQLMNKEDGYGYFIWKYGDGFSLNGKWGQRCYILPESELMVTYLSHMEDNSHELQRCMEKYTKKRATE